MHGISHVEARSVSIYGLYDHTMHNESLYDEEVHRRHLKI